MPKPYGPSRFNRHKPGATKAKVDRIVDVWWWSDPSIDKQIVQILKSLGAPFPITSSTPLRIGWRLHTRQTVLRVQNALRRRSEGASGKLDMSIKEVDTPPQIHEASMEHRREQVDKPFSYTFKTMAGVQAFFEYMHRHHSQISGYYGVNGLTVESTCSIPADAAKYIRDKIAKPIDRQNP